MRPPDAEVYTNDDVRSEALEYKRIAVLGYGNQGRAHAQNLRNSGFDVVQVLLISRSFIPTAEVRARALENGP